MKNTEKTKEQLLKENDILKERIVELEKFKTRSDQTEITRKESEEKYKMIYEKTPLSYQSLDSDGNFLDVNPMWITTLGYTKKEVIGKWFGDFLHPDYVESFRNNFLKFKQIGTVTDVQYYIRKKNGEYIYISLEGRIGYTSTGEFKQTYCVFKDITEQKKAEKELLESKNQFKSLIEQAGDAMFLSDFDGNILAVNNKSCESMGYNRKELLSMNVTELDAVYIELEQARAFWNKLAPGESQTLKTIHKRKDGTVFPVEIRIGVIETEGKKTILGIARDITERKKAEQLLKDSEYLLRESQKIAVLGSYILDITNGIWNSSLVLDDIFGINKKYIKNIDTWVKFVHTDDRDMMQDYFATNVLTNHETFDKVYRIKRINDKQVRWVHGLGELEFDDDGNPIKMMGTIQDITERKQVEDTLATHRQRLTYILEGTNAGTWDWNIPSGECVFNDRWAEIMGYSLKELEPIDINTWINNVHPDDLPKANEMLNKVFNKELDYFDVVFRQPHKDGNWVWVNARGKVVDWSEEGKPLRISGTHLDITKQMQAQEELRKHRDHLEQLVKERTAEVDEKNKKLSDQMKVFVGRELTIRNLENRIKALGGE